MRSVIGTPNVTLGAVVALEVMKAIRGGTPLESCIATLIAQAEVLQISLPVVNAAIESQRSPT
jgi:hypothetical protein